MNNFKDYGFEADFEGEILKEVDGYYIGWASVLGYGLESCKWSKSGSMKYSVYDLIPIKKPWYKNPDNFPCLVIEDDENLLICNDTYEWIDLDIHHSGNFRPATKEEVLALLVKE